MKAISIIITFFIVLFFVTSFVQADELNDQTRKIAHKLRCPTCQGLSVKESEAGLATNMKLTIRTMLEEGKTEEEILQFFVDRYGEWILRSPLKKGFNLILWVTPGLGILIAVLILFQYVRRRSIRIIDQNTSPLTDNEKNMIDKELRELKKD